MESRLESKGESRLFRIAIRLKKYADDPQLIIISAFMASHPAFFLLAVCNGIWREGAGNIFGIIIIGVLFGFVFLRFRAKLNPDFKSAGGVIFLTAPAILFILTSLGPGILAVNFNINLFWILAFFVYLAAGAVLYVKNNANNADNADNLNNTELYAVALFAPFLIFALLINFITRGTLYSVDSYSYYEMSKTIFTDFGLVNATRQYTIFTDYGISFPYLFPAAIAVFDFFTGFGMFSGVCVNIAAALVSFYFILRISNKLARSPVPGLLVSFVLFFNTDYLSEMTAARAVPLSLLCALFILDIISSGSGKPGRKELFWAGLAAGAGIVIRFDFLVITGLLGVAVIFIFKKNFFKPIIFYALGVLVLTAPWILYSIIRFGAPWVSDNSGTLFLVTPQIPQRYFAPGEIIPDMFGNFSAWFVSRQHILMHGLAGFFSIATRPVEFILILCAAGAGILSSGAPRVQPEPETFKISAVARAAILIYAAKSAAIFLVGYSDLRYHTETLIIIALTLLCVFYAPLAGHKAWTCFLLLIFSVALINNMQPALKDSIQPKLNAAFVSADSVVPDPGTIEVKDILTQVSGDINSVRLFFIYSGDDYTIKTNPYKLGAFTDIKTYARIANINEERLLYLFKNYIKPNYIFAPDSEQGWLRILREYYIIEKLTDAPPLYFVGEYLEELDGGSVRASSIADNNWTSGVSVRSPVLLFRNTGENYKKLESAVILGSGGIYLSVESFYYDENWIYIECDAETYELAPFGYPNKITVLK